MRKIRLRYATKSKFKHDEVNEVVASAIIKNRHGAEVRAKDYFEVEFPSVVTNEPLERNLEKMVRHKAISAYQSILEPCIVEHAGLILKEYSDPHYPGGLTQPMWDALGAEGFLKSVTWAGPKVTARAVVGYCDGMNVHVFIGETEGIFSQEPRGSREFYWDTVFIPETGGGRTYAEISAEEGGLVEKVKLSQSMKAMTKCFEFMIDREPIMFPG